MLIRFTKVENKISGIISNSELKLLSEYKRALREIRLILSEMYDKFGDKVTLGELNRYNRFSAIEKELLQQIKSVYGVSLNSTTKLIKDVYSESYYRTGFVLENETGLKFGFQKLNNDVLLKVVENPLDKVKWQIRGKTYHERAAQQVTSELTQGLIRGDGYVQTARNIKAKIDGLANDTLRIVRTETHRAANLARDEGINRAISAGDRLGLTVYKVWDAGNSKDSRSNHSAMDGQKADAEGKFTMQTQGGSVIKVDSPGNTGLASEDINCNCFLKTEIEGVTNVDKPEYNSFDQWYVNRIN